jgi:hypothetical protein
LIVLQLLEQQPYRTTLAVAQASDELGFVHIDVGNPNPTSYVCQPIPRFRVSVVARWMRFGHCQRFYERFHQLLRTHVRSGNSAIGNGGT